MGEGLVIDIPHSESAEFMAQKNILRVKLFQITTTKQHGLSAAKYPLEGLSGDHIVKFLPVPTPNTAVKLSEPMIVHTSVKVGIAGFLKLLCCFQQRSFFVRIQSLEKHEQEARRWAAMYHSTLESGDVMQERSALPPAKQVASIPSKP